MKEQVLDSLPSMLGLYIKAARKKGHTGEWPELSVTIPGVRADSAVIRNYEKVCRFPKSRFLPPTLLHILSFPLQMELVTHPSMPLKPMGMVHVRNTIRQYRPVEKGELLHIECTLGECRSVEVGLEFDVFVRIHAGGELVWESESTNLSRQKPSGGNKKKAEPPENLGIVQTWALPSSLGRKYGAVSGDRNPIHLWPMTARMLGFKRHIIHGMWSKARCLAALMPEVGEKPFEFSVSFKTPVYLPSRVEFSHESCEEGITMLLRSPSGRPHLTGDIRFL
ncbi:acyl dehydratase [Sansalvadorimonas sp. 2012CJ34-2]|uniref:Acyl dehydratase n=1 Tax=Parendozoicomonas callyspongiae TaxID=2942213 RepID=A0ABT0PEG2_9GAMM|nr:MaoC/PaaZ C-terminal domain-containing protein [Sansalvadorimonas sp. 2012CJ34-2]MCL6269596.1 acyl dehydratase [Sansalvadorimonas sp. 2012CJ34-2]